MTLTFVVETRFHFDSGVASRLRLVVVDGCLLVEIFVVDYVFFLRHFIKIAPFLNKRRYLQSILSP